MGKLLMVVLLFCLAGAPRVEGAALGLFVPGQDQNPDQNPDQNQNQDQNSAYQPFSSEQIDNLLSPVALYPDPLLAQVLVAATFPDQVEEAARWVRGNGQNGVDEQDWDVSVRAVAHYPTVIQMLADKIDWTTSVGQAYVNQSTDVAASVQRLRHMARSVGNLDSTPQQQVLVNGEYIAITPNQPQFVYVPVYDPAISYYRRPFYGPAITFGVGFPIGAWLNLDFRWGFGGGWGGVYYTGWRQGGWGGGCWNCGWINRSRGFVNVRNNVYINNRYTNISVNRTVVNRSVNVNNINRYNYIHKNVNYNNVQVNNNRNNRFNNGRGNGNVRPSNMENNSRPPVNNKIIDRNINTNSNRIDQFRGRENNRNDRPPQAQPGRPGNQPASRPEQQNRPVQQPNRPANQPPNREQTRPAQQTRPAPAARPEGPHGFGRSEGNFDPRASSQRGQASRQQTSKPAQAARPAPRAAAPARQESKPAAAPRGGERRKP